MAAVDLFVQRVITDDRWMNDAACRGLTHLFLSLIHISEPTRPY